MKKLILLGLLAFTLLIAACVSSNRTDKADDPYSVLAFDNTSWHYDEEYNIYWQIGIVYCKTPEAVEYESLGIYVPGDYIMSVSNGDGTYTCRINESAQVNGYTARTAPIILPINTAGYSGQYAPTDYTDTGLKPFMDAGFIYVFAGCRGRDNGYGSDGTLTYNGGAPWGVTGLKAAVRYLRYNEAALPGNTECIFTLGHSGGGAQSALMGASGDSELYFPYLESIGAVMYDRGVYVSDAVYGSKAWCPITGFDYADQGYEWMMGQYFNTYSRADDTWTSAFSGDLSESYAQYINRLGLTDTSGRSLTLISSPGGIYSAGSYYDCLLSEIERSLNNFLADTEFPYTPGTVSFKTSAGLPGEGSPPAGMNTAGGVQWSGSGGWGSGGASPETFPSAQAYIDSLNRDDVWVVYKKETNTAAITGVGAFAAHLKTPTNSVGAFDSLERTTAENFLFGDSAHNALHYNADMARLLQANRDSYAKYTDWDGVYAEAYQEYLVSVDALGSDSLYRQDMYNPLYYLLEYYGGYGTSAVAKHWRINSGIIQGNAPLTMDLNLALALAEYGSVDFEMVWAQSHTTAERKGDFISNFIQWVINCP
ncbi:subtype A tannase [Breznakiella homolactica]|uniref:Tannase n=1 Tax=Breznakiella homolactica TaxID=2798577 RepID=A0A7T7XLY8_9SPIR|nr:subtype A tannase [Breznakiella homolactica]QQO08712.1 hypothetical protein JFL75_17565 [Breznakiella homolactica]